MGKWMYVDSATRDLKATPLLTRAARVAERSRHKSLGKNAASSEGADERGISLLMSVVHVTSESTGRSAAYAWAQRESSPHLEWFESDASILLADRRCAETRFPLPYSTALQTERRSAPMDLPRHPNRCVISKSMRPWLVRAPCLVHSPLN